MPTISVIIPIYDRAEYVTSTIKSVLSQTFDDLEVIIVDRTGANISEPRLQKLIDQDDRIQYYRLDSSKNLSELQNEGLRRSTGRFVNFLDALDTIHSRKLEFQISLLEPSPASDMAICQTLFFTKNEGDLPFVQNTLEDSNFLDRFLRGNEIWSAASVLWRRSLLDELGGWDEQVSGYEALNIHLRALCLGAKVQVAPKALAYWRYDRSRIPSPKPNYETTKSLVRTYEKARRMLQDKNLLTKPRSFVLASHFLRCAVNFASLRKAADERYALQLANESYPQKRLKAKLKTMRPIALGLPMVVPAMHGISLSMLEKVKLMVSAQTDEVYRAKESELDL